MLCQTFNIEFQVMSSPCQYEDDSDFQTWGIYVIKHYISSVYTFSFLIIKITHHHSRGPLPGIYSQRLNVASKYKIKDAICFLITETINQTHFSGKRIFQLVIKFIAKKIETRNIFLGPLKIFFFLNCLCLCQI